MNTFDDMMVFAFNFVHLIYKRKYFSMWNVEKLMTTNHGIVCFRSIVTVRIEGVFLLFSCSDLA